MNDYYDFDPEDLFNANTDPCNCGAPATAGVAHFPDKYLVVHPIFGPINVTQVHVFILCPTCMDFASSTCMDFASSTITEIADLEVING